MFKYKNRLISIGFFTIFIFLLIKYFNYEKSSVDAFDNLDGTFVNWSLLSNSYIEYFNPLFKIQQIANGTLIGNVFPQVNIGEIIFKILSPLNAYIINELLMRLIGFIGFFLLLNKYFNFKKSHLFLSFFTSLSFAFLPFNPSPFLTVAGMPLLLYSILNFYNYKTSRIDWIICIIFPFYSSLVLGGFAILIFIFIILIFQFIKEKTFNLKLLFILSLMSFLYLASIYKGLYLIFYVDDYQSIRSIFPSAINLDFDSIFMAIRNSLGLFIFGHEHAPSMHTYFIFFSVIFAIFLFKKKLLFEDKILIQLLSLNIIISIIYGFIAYASVDLMLFKNFKYLKMIKLERIHWLQPVIWYLILYLSLSKINNSEIFKNKNLNVGKLKYFFLAIALIVYLVKFLYLESLENRYVLQYPDILIKIKYISSFIIFLSLTSAIIFFIFKNKNFFNQSVNYKYLLLFFILFSQIFYNLNILKINRIFTFDYRYSWHHNGIDTTTFDKYFMSGVFNQIDKEIYEKKDSFRVVSVGLSPSIALYHGFYVLDFYLSSYDLNYKNFFKNIIDNEIKKNDIIYNYYSGSGKRSYIFSAELGKNLPYFKKDVPNEIHLDINIDELKKLGCKYIFSITKIKLQKGSIKLIKQIINTDYLYLNDIFIYQLT